MKSYHDIVGDGGSRILEQVAEQRARITDALAGVRHLVAVGSGKGGVGKSTLTLHLAAALRARGLRIAILDADFNGPSQARMAGVERALFVPPPSPRPLDEARGRPEFIEGRASSRGYGETSGEKLALPKTSNGIAVFSMGSIVPELEALEFESAAQGESHTWRATREFALLGEILASFEWGALDLLLFDLPPGAERTVQYADYLGPFGLAQGRPRLSFLLVTIPSEVARGVVARSVAALSRGPFDGAQGRPFDGAQGRPFDGAQGRPFDGAPFDGAQGRPFDRAQGRPNRILGYVENMSGYYCRDCNAIKPLFVSSEPFDSADLAQGRPFALGEIPCLGSVPFDPELARHCDQGIVPAKRPETPVGLALDQIARRLLERLP